MHHRHSRLAGLAPLLFRLACLPPNDLRLRRGGRLVGDLLAWHRAGHDRLLAVEDGPCTSRKFEFTNLDSVAQFEVSQQGVDTLRNMVGRAL